MSTRRTESPLRVGIVGAGYIGTTVGAEFAAVGGATVAAVADPNAEARDAAADSFGVPDDRRFDDWETMANESDLDAVLVGTPHTLHYDQVTGALDRGLHVLCDKPLTTDLGEALRLRDRVREGDQTLMVGYQRHLDPSFLAARERYDGADAPTPEWITAEISQDWVDRFEGTWRLNPDLSGGGYLYDTGSHLLDAVLWTTGLTPARVSAQMEFVDDERRVDSFADLTVKFEEGAVASVSTYGETPCTRENIHIWDEAGATYVTGREWTARDVTFVDEENTSHNPYFDYRNARTKAETFVEAVREGTKPPATVEDGLRVTAVTEAAYESARSGGEWVDIRLD